MTPVVIVTAYYSTQDQIFGFTRNSTSFIIAVLVMYLALKTANILTVLARRFIRPNGILTLIALGRLDRLIELEKENGKFLHGTTTQAANLVQISLHPQALPKAPHTMKSARKICARIIL